MMLHAAHRLQNPRADSDIVTVAGDVAMQVALVSDQILHEPIIVEAAHARDRRRLACRGLANAEEHAEDAHEAWFRDQMPTLEGVWGK